MDGRYAILVIWIVLLVAVCSEPSGASSFLQPETSPDFVFNEGLPRTRRDDKNNNYGDSLAEVLRYFLKYLNQENLAQKQTYIGPFDDEDDKVLSMKRLKRNVNPEENSPAPKSMNAAIANVNDQIKDSDKFRTKRSSWFEKLSGVDKEKMKNKLKNKIKSWINRGRGRFNEKVNSCQKEDKCYRILKSVIDVRKVAQNCYSNVPQAKGLIKFPGCNKDVVVPNTVLECISLHKGMITPEASFNSLKLKKDLRAAASKGRSFRVARKVLMATSTCPRVIRFNMLPYFECVLKKCRS